MMENNEKKKEKDWITIDPEKVQRIVNALRPENLQRYLLGYKKSGQPRALYDIYKDHALEDNKKSKKRRKASRSTLDYFRGKELARTKKRDKHWRY